MATSPCYPAITTSPNVQPYQDSTIMSCLYCGATSTTEQAQRTALGYRKLRCEDSKQLFNERPGTPVNFLEYPTAIVLRRRVGGALQAESARYGDALDS